MDTPSIDDLLERYLALLDEHTQLRSSLSEAQSGMFHNIARANFSAERGFRYGPDHYDDRMQALRRVAISCDAETGRPSFSISVVEPAHQTEGPKDPLKWFGILTPMALRQAQGQAIRLVQDTVPRLVSLNAQMADLEIQVRRARKKRAKAEAAEHVSRDEVVV